jgi:transcriptional regulator with XRE-family HTH domain
LRAGLSQAAVARLADVHTRTILGWENDQAPIPKLAALGLLVLFDDYFTNHHIHKK